MDHSWPPTYTIIFRTALSDKLGPIIHLDGFVDSNKEEEEE